MKRTVIYTTPSGVKLPGSTTEEPGADGRIFVIFAAGGQGNVDASRVVFTEDKDAPRVGLETK